MLELAKSSGNCSIGTYTVFIPKFSMSFLDEKFNGTDKLIIMPESQQHCHVVLCHQNDSYPNQEIVSNVKMKNSSEQNS